MNEGNIFYPPPGVNIAEVLVWIAVASTQWPLQSQNLWVKNERCTPLAPFEFIVDGAFLRLRPLPAKLENGKLSDRLERNLSSLIATLRLRMVPSPRPPWKAPLQAKAPSPDYPRAPAARERLQGLLFSTVREDRLTKNRLSCRQPPPKAVEAPNAKFPTTAVARELPVTYRLVPSLLPIPLVRPTGPTPSSLKPDLRLLVGLHVRPRSLLLAMSSFFAGWQWRRPMRAELSVLFI